MSAGKVITEAGKWVWKNKQTIILAAEGVKTAGKWVYKKIKNKKNRI